MVKTALNRAALMGLLTVASLHGCDKAPEPAQPVSWYVAHDDAREAKVRWCADDMHRKDTPDCRNALEANQRKAMGSMKDAPPLDWNKPDPKPH